MSMYQTGELVVYGSSGVCRVDALTKPVSRGRTAESYSIF